MAEIDTVTMSAGGESFTMTGEQFDRGVDAILSRPEGQTVLGALGVTDEEFRAEAERRGEAATVQLIDHVTDWEGGHDSRPLADDSGLYPVPMVTAFRDRTGVLGPFMDAPDLVGLADTLMERHPGKLGWLRRRRLRYLWAREGGQKDGEDQFHRVKLLKGEVSYVGGEEAIVTLAADHCRDGRVTNRQVEAMLCEALEGIGMSSKGSLMAYPPVRVSIWTASIYGLWKPDLKQVAVVMRQIPMPLEEGR